MVLKLIQDNGDHGYFSAIKNEEKRIVCVNTTFLIYFLSSSYSITVEALLIYSASTLYRINHPLLGNSDSD